MPLSKEDKDDVKVGRALEAMMATEGWQHYTRILEVKIEEQRVRILQPFVLVQEVKAREQVLFNAWDHVLYSESIKGAILGLSLAKNLPSGIISNMQDVLARAKDDTDGDEE